VIVVDASAVFSVLLGQPIGEVVLRALRGGAQGSRRTGTSTGRVGSITLIPLVTMCPLAPRKP
jgi:hypothetical protein